MVAGIGRLLAGYHHRAIHVPRTRRVARSLAALAGRQGAIGSLLDVGCGDGMVVRQVGELLGCDEVRGVDVKVRPHSVVAVDGYDGKTLPFDDRRFDVVLLADVLRHAEAPEELLRECLRVASLGVALKDHFAFGALSERLLLLMDVIGNAEPGVAVRGDYLHPQQWFELVSRAGGRIAAIDWPLKIHDLPWRAVTRSELQFAALIEHAPLGDAASGQREKRGGQ